MTTEMQQEICELMDDLIREQKEINTKIHRITTELRILELRKKEYITAINQMLNHNDFLRK